MEVKGTNTRSKEINQGTGRLLRLIFLDGLWRIRWYHTCFMWIWLLVFAWEGSPFLAYAIGFPDPGTAPRYTGTVRIEGELQRTRHGWKPPKYFIQTPSGDIEFHCGFLPIKRECWLREGLGGKIVETDIYTIGYAPYFGVDYTKYPESLSSLTYGSSESVKRRRISHLRAHRFGLGLSIALLAAYLASVIYYRKKLEST
jgi:hypothetical protein